MTDWVLSAELKVKLSLSIPCSSTQFSVGGGGQLRALALLPPGKEPWYPLNRRLGGPQSWSGSYREQKHFLPLQDSNSGLSSLQPNKCTNYLGWLPLTMKITVFYDVILRSYVFLNPSHGGSRYLWCGYLSTNYTSSILGRESILHF